MKIYELHLNEPIANSLLVGFLSMHPIYACIMNILSFIYSRAHTIVAITFVQKTPNETGQSMTRTSVVNLVDLAGR